MTAYERTFNRRGLFVVCCTLAGIAIGAVAGHGLAQMAPPTEHKGLNVEKLGVISEDSMKATIGLEGHFLQLRAITIEPGGQIAKHSHETRPGLVAVIDGAWVEGRESGETTFDAGASPAIIEDENTVHWFYNRGDTPATAIVCDINPTG
nr:cupin domain-containing protein [Desulfuromonadales bacterium]